jgi:hypothetical protein
VRRDAFYDRRLQKLLDEKGIPHGDDIHSKPTQKTIKCQAVRATKVKQGANSPERDMSLEVVPRLARRTTRDIVKSLTHATEEGEIVPDRECRVPKGGDEQFKCVFDLQTCEQQPTSR